MTMIDIHVHILPGVDDGAKNWEESLKMAQMAVNDGIRVMVATPHLFKGRTLDLDQLNDKEFILQLRGGTETEIVRSGNPLGNHPGL